MYFEIITICSRRAKVVNIQVKQTCKGNIFVDAILRSKQMNHWIFLKKLLKKQHP
ncbi:hypothetical protein ADIS_4299 [Lunatimonas lonarensis]|uniref:Uncharacterized protein n=1 Tax=Lunatimonas lonarensis TaxID=1232681 RepID=R7ZM05_9BACT|nr:hypothetical protein ADIS_4299 [Lunatimonas lonarensis]